MHYIQIRPRARPAARGVCVRRVAAAERVAGSVPRREAVAGAVVLWGGGHGEEMWPAVELRDMRVTGPVVHHPQHCCKTARAPLCTLLLASSSCIRTRRWAAIGRDPSGPTRACPRVTLWRLSGLQCRSNHP